MMDFEEIIRSSPRQQAPPCIAEGFSPTARGVYGLNAQSSLAQQQALLWGIGYWLFLCPASSAPIGYRLSAIPLPGVQRCYRLSAIRLFLCPASSAPIGYRLSAIPLPDGTRRIPDYILNLHYSLVGSWQPKSSLRRTIYRIERSPFCD